MGSAPRALPLVAVLLAMSGTVARADQEGSAGPADAPVRHLIDFELEDQFRRTWTQDVVAGTVVICIVTGRRTGDAAHAWGDRLAEVVGDELERGELAVLAVAHIRGVPRLLRGIVVGRLPKREDRWVLMDWKGIFADAYGLDTDVATLLLFDADGVLRSSFESTEVIDEQVALLQARIAEILPVER